MDEAALCDVQCAGDIIRRYRNNPIIDLRALPFVCADICNAGAIKVDGEYILLVTVQTLEGVFRIHTARGRNGYTFEISEKPFMSPSRGDDSRVYEEQGILDARITAVNGTYYITYDALGPHGYCLALARTEDFQSVQRIGIITEPDNKGGALFPRMINGKYTLFQRPWSGGSIWINYSEDLEYWGGSEILMTPRAGYWDSSRIGAATPPMEIEEGWLFIYYGIKDTSAGPLFRLGAAILDRDEPTRLIGRTNVPILSPRLPYERIGDVNNLVFSCGAILEPDGELKLYYGAADSCICLGSTHVSTVVQTCMESEREF